MKINKTNAKVDLGNGSSYVVYITRSMEEADVLHCILATQVPMHKYPWEFHISSVSVLQDCRIPAFFHDRGYWATIIEHNNGDWDKEPTYELYIVE